MPDSSKSQLDTPHPFFDALRNAPSGQGDAQLNDISEKLDRLIALLSPPKSIIITGAEVERIIEQIQKKELP